MSKMKTQGKYVGPTHRRNKMHFDLESDALKSILEAKGNENERESNLDAYHSKKQWVWKAKTNFK